MAFTITIPSAGTMRTGQESYKDLPAGTILHRVHPEVYSAEQFNDTDKGNARFSPIRDNLHQLIPTIYGAGTFECAVYEIILRCPDSPLVSSRTGSSGLRIISPSDYIGYCHSTVRTRHSIRLVELTVTGQRRIGVDHNALLAGPRSTYPETRAWAEKIHSLCPDAQGLYYNSYQGGPDYAAVLFGDRVPRDLLEPVSSRRISTNPCHNQVRQLAHQLFIQYEDI